VSKGSLRTRQELLAEIERLRRRPGVDAAVMRALLAAAANPAFLLDAAGTVLAANAAAEALLAAAPGEATGQAFSLLAVDCGGHELIPVAGEAGEFLRLAVFPAERGLAESLSGWRGQKQRLLSAFLDHSLESCLLLDADLTVLACNRIAAERLGIAPDAPSMPNLCELLDVQASGRRLAHIREAFDSGRAVRFEDERGPYFFETRVIPLADPDGTVRMAAVLAREISDERRAEEAMAASFLERDHYRRDLEVLFRSIPDAIFTVDRDLRVRDANREPGEVCPLLAGVGQGFLFSGCPEGCLGALTETLASGAKVVEYRVDCPAQPGRVVVLTSAPLPRYPEERAGADADAGPAGALLIVRDVSRLAKLERAARDRSRYGGMAGQSPVMLRLFDLLERLAGLATTVLITGESGTGKELAAEALHRGGSRSKGPLVKVNCSALSEHLLESELFGHVKGAFTGADRDKEGRFQAAEGGTVFLDEIGDISAAIQLKLLRFLECREFEPVGSSRTIRADVRVVAATNADLAAKVASGQFRADLYFRLRVMVVHMPPLRERPGDIALLTQLFLAEFGKAMHKNFTTPSLEVMDALMRHPWPGNVRELRHALEHACILCPGGAIALEHLPPEFLAPGQMPGAAPAFGRDKTGREAVAEALRRAGGNKSKAARFLGVNRRTVYRKIEDYGLDSQ
jgi:DNA-binding NtrC family response regulator/PAS domain-containing protein